MFRFTSLMNSASRTDVICYLILQAVTFLMSRRVRLKSHSTLQQGWSWVLSHVTLTQYEPLTDDVSLLTLQSIDCFPPHQISVDLLLMLISEALLVFCIICHFKSCHCFCNRLPWFKVNAFHADK